jgi:beta-galactosidase
LAKPGLRQRTMLDADWRFHRGEVASSNAVLAAEYDDRSWQPVNVPHDYVLDGTFSETNSRNHGYLPYPVGWYRKHFSIPAAEQGKVLQLEFGGVFRDSQVWLNGQYLGHHPGGYTPFYYDISKVARYGARNVLVVRVDPSQFEGWWYEGGGIYRHVYLTALAPLHVAHWGTYVTAQVPGGDQGADAEANLTFQTTVHSQQSAPAKCDVVSEIIGSNGRVLQTLRKTQTVSAGGQQEFVQRTTIEKPRLWSPESPRLYRLRTTILQDGRPVDATTTTFGIRTIRYDAQRGFFLNGKHIELHGAANHQDFVAVGIAVPDSLQPWRVRQLKRMGCNAWRTAHNAPNVAVLDACDRLGMMVMDENRHLGDSLGPKAPRGTPSTDLSELATMIRRDRNHPSIIMWSLCNEEHLQGTRQGAAIFTNMMNVVHHYDRTRPITCAMNSGWLKPGIADVEDIIGVNYGYKSFEAIHRRHPNKPMFGSEDHNQKTTRGQYVNDRAEGMSSCYNLSEDTWLSVVERPFMAGSFNWTGFDYKGEPNPYGWPDVSNNTGLMDACGFPKDKYYYFESCWSAKPMVHLMPDSWNWPGKEAQPIRVLAFSNGRRVELFLNGRSLRATDLPQDSHAEWQVPYAPGRLLAKAYRDGKVVATEKLDTTGPAVRLQLAPQRTRLHADDEDTVVVPVSLLDAKGRLVPDASNRVQFHLEGPGRILGVGNGNPADHDPDRATERNAFHGHCIAVIQAGTQPAVLRLTATSPGLRPATVTFRVH